MRVWLPGVANKIKADTLIVLFLVFAWAMGLACGFIAHSHTFTRTITHRQSIQDQYGRPTQVVDGAQINSALAGLRCSVYDSRKTIICAP